jgi:hypothetical protein
MAHTAKLFLAGLGVTIIGMIQISSATDETKPPVAEVRPYWSPFPSQGWVNSRSFPSTIEKVLNSSFLARSQDVAAVYKELLKEYKPRNIGIYGCSAGGTLTAMAVAWLQKENLATPGAIGIFSAGALASFSSAPAVIGAWGGDSRFTTPPLVGEKSPPIDSKLAPAVPTDVTTYLSTANLADPLVSRRCQLPSWRSSLQHSSSPALAPMT